MSSQQKTSHLLHVADGHGQEEISSLMTQWVLEQMWSQSNAVLSDAFAVEDYWLRK